ncbi:MAG: hypothetical protein ACJAZO_000842 [Myxococcota bacterium]|jgi:hypothetical protein
MTLDTQSLGSDGVVVARFPSNVEPMGADLLAAVNASLES